MHNADFIQFIRPVKTQEDAKFWAMVRTATSSEHGIKMKYPQEVMDYIKARESLRDIMLQKLMFTDNTLAIMVDQGKGEHIVGIEESHLNAKVIFEKEKANILQRDEVAELPEECVDRNTVELFLKRLDPNCFIIFLSRKQYGKKGQGQIAQEVYKASRRLGREVFLLGCQFTKQKGAMSHEMYLSSTIVMTFQRKILEAGIKTGFDYDPSVFPLFISKEEGPYYTMSRRMDGAFPWSINPKVLWETKEYYDNKSYGSRVNDSIFETMLSGGEIAEVEKLFPGVKVGHYLFVDGYYCFGFMGKALLLRYIDCFFQEVVDDIVLGSDVVTTWPKMAEELVNGRSPAKGMALLNGA